MFRTEIFKLFGSIMVNNDKANEAIDETDQKAQETTKTFGEMLGSAAKVGAGIAMAMGAAVVAVGGLAVKLTDDLQKSLNGVQSATGVTDEAMIGMKDTMLAIYNNNFGENFEEIGTVMGIVAQQTGLAGEELQKMTEGAFALRDTFEMDVAGSVETAGVMMKNFGLSSDEAYNLIAQGAQNGLNKQGDLLDILKEYGPHFASLGFSAEEAMNMLINGAEGGVFSVDQLGDVVHEFGRKMREEDLSKPLQQLGLDSVKYTTMVAQGGETAKQAFAEIAQKISAIKDPVLQNQIGISIFGDMMGEVGIKGVLAMSNTQGAISNTVDALGKINEVKYDTFGQAMEGIKRNLQTGILLPLGDEILPAMNNFANWIIKNMPSIKNEIEYAMGIAGDAINKAGVAITETKEFFTEHWNVVEPILAGIAAGAITIGTMTAATKLWTLATQAATVAQGALNVVMNLSPWAKVALLIGALVTAGVALYQNWDTVKLKAKELWTAIDVAFKNGVNGAIDMINSLIKQINKIPGVNAPLIARVKVVTENKSSAKSVDERLGNNAQGTDSWRGGLTWVGEQGPEIVNLPRGSQVFSNSESMRMASVGATPGGVTININGANIMDDYGVDRLMDRVMDRLALKGVR